MSSIWTSPLKLETDDPRDCLEFCSIINCVLRCDLSDAARSVAVFARCTNQLCIMRNSRGPESIRFPAGGVLWRGGALPDEHRPFFSEGLKCRVPGFIASSSCKDVTYQFLYKANYAFICPHVPSSIPETRALPSLFRTAPYLCMHITTYALDHTGLLRRSSNSPMAH